MASVEDLKRIADIFLEDDEMCIEIYPKAEDYVNIEEFTLHLWKTCR